MVATALSSDLPKKFAYKVTFVGGPLSGISHWYPISKGAKVRPEIVFKEFLHDGFRSTSVFILHQYLCREDPRNHIPAKTDQPYTYGYLNP
jgi:hypothetical protein